MSGDFKLSRVVDRSFFAFFSFPYDPPRLSASFDDLVTGRI